MPIIRYSIGAVVPDIAPNYHHHVLNGTQTFETDPPGEADMAMRPTAAARAGIRKLIPV